MIIEMDTRNQKDKYITDFLDKNGVKWIRNKLYTGDVKLLNSTKVIFDLKANLLELVGNLCNGPEHKRVVKEIERAKEIGCEEFIFLIKDDSIKNIDDIKKWNSKYSKVKGEMILKVMDTMSKKYGVKFVFTTKKDAAKIIMKKFENMY